MQLQQQNSQTMATHKTTSTHRKQSRKWLLHDLNQQDIFRESHFLRSLDGLQTPVYTFSWSNSRQDRPFIAIGGYDEYPDRSELSVAYFDRQTDKAKLLTTAKHPYTPAKTAWMPCAVESAVSAPLIGIFTLTFQILTVLFDITIFLFILLQSLALFICCSSVFVFYVHQ